MPNSSCSFREMKVFFPTSATVSKGSRGDRGPGQRRKSTSSTGGDEPTQYLGLLIGHGDNGPSAKPLFSTFKAEGHVTSACLWHACRAVTIGSLLIVMGITMAVLGKTI